MRALLFADENFPLQTVRALRRLGWDVLAARDVGLNNKRIPDDVVLEYAVRLDRAVITFDAEDYAALHSRVGSHAGIVICDVQSDFETLANDIDAQLSLMPNLKGKLIEVSAKADPS